MMCALKSALRYRIRAVGVLVSAKPAQVTFH